MHLFNNRRHKCWREFFCFFFFYKPPSFPTPFFCNLLDDFSSFTNWPQKKAIVFGDFNCNLINVNNNNDCDTFFETFTSSFLLPAIFFPIGVDPMRCTAIVIDNILVSTFDLSDHFPMYLYLPSAQPTWTIPLCLLEYIILRIWTDSRINWNPLTGPRFWIAKMLIQPQMVLHKDWVILSVQPFQSVNQTEKLPIYTPGCTIAW